VTSGRLLLCRAFITLGSSLRCASTSWGGVSAEQSTDLKAGHQGSKPPASGLRQPPAVVQAAIFDPAGSVAAHLVGQVQPRIGYMQERAAMLRRGGGLGEMHAIFRKPSIISLSSHDPLPLARPPCETAAPVQEMRRAGRTQGTRKGEDRPPRLILSMRPFTNGSLCKIEHAGAEKMQANQGPCGLRTLASAKLGPRCSILYRLAFIVWRTVRHRIEPPLTRRPVLIPR
jgi:hypothetical protein